MDEFEEMSIEEIILPIYLILATWLLGVNFFHAELRSRSVVYMPKLQRIIIFPMDEFKEMSIEESIFPIYSIFATRRLGVKFFLTQSQNNAKY